MLLKTQFIHTNKNVIKNTKILTQKKNVSKNFRKKFEEGKVYF